MHSFKWWGGGGEGYTLTRVYFSHPFGLKTVRDFAHFGQESDMVFEGNTEVYERNCRFNSK